MRALVLLVDSVGPLDLPVQPRGRWLDVDVAWSVTGCARPRRRFERPGQRRTSPGSRRGCIPNRTSDALGHTTLDIQLRVRSAARIVPERDGMGWKRALAKQPSPSSGQALSIVASDGPPA